MKKKKEPKETDKPPRRSLPIREELYLRVETLGKREFEGRAVVRIAESVIEDVLDMIERPEIERVLPRIVAEFDARRRRAPFKASRDAGRQQEPPQTS